MRAFLLLERRFGVAGAPTHPYHLPRAGPIRCALLFVNTLDPSAVLYLLRSTLLGGKAIESDSSSLNLSRAAGDPLLIAIVIVIVVVFVIVVRTRLVDVAAVDVTYARRSGNVIAITINIRINERMAR